MTPSRTTVFTDASSAILLYKAGLFDLLAQTWQVVMAVSVFKEITEKGYPGADFFRALGRDSRENAVKIICREPFPSDLALFGQDNFMAMGKGEKDTIQLFYNLTGPGRDLTETCAFVLVDDGRAARICHAQQIPFINALLVPKIFWYSGHMDQTEYVSKTACLCGLGRYSPKVTEMARQFLKEALTYFIEGTPMADNCLQDPVLWKKKATAFVTRSHHHLWGKNNEDPQVFLFRQDLSNLFIKKMHLGWNKHGQERTLEKWGLKIQGNRPQTGTFFLPAGIVFPYIVAQELLAVWIHPLDPEGACVLVPGSATDRICLGDPMNPVKKVDGLFVGLRLFQEEKERLCIEIRP